MTTGSMFISLLTTPFISTMLGLSAFFMGSYIYGYLSDEEDGEYSQFIKSFNTMGDVFYSCLVVAGITFAIGGLAFLITADSYSDVSIYPIGHGMYFYGFVALAMIVFYTTTNRRRRRDIKGRHKHQVKALQMVITANLAELSQIQTFEGKTKLRIDRVKADFLELQAKIKSEQRIAKNTKNLSRSLTRLADIEAERLNKLQIFFSIQTDIEKIYDMIYDLESILVQEHYEEDKKKFNIAKEKMDSDPFAAIPLLNQIKAGKSLAS